MSGKMITPDDGFNRVHTYFKGSPYHPDGDRVLYTRFTALGSTAEVCLISRSTGEETVLGETQFYTYHNGGKAYFCDGGRKVIYRSREDEVAVCDIESRKTLRFPGNLCPYSGVLAHHFIQKDEDFPLETQNKMGIYLRTIDGAQTRLLADVDRLLDNSPYGGNIRRSEILLRLGGEISPDQKKVILFLVSRNGTLVRDYYTCDLDGSNLEFHGPLGTHIMWHANSRDILSYAKPWHTVIGSMRKHVGSDFRKNGFLASYNTETHEAAVLSEHPIIGSCHVSPSPDGKKVTLDDFNQRSMKILVFEYDSRRMNTVAEMEFAQTSDERGSAVLSDKPGDKELKQFDINPHPVFSLDSKTIVFNTRTGPTIRLCEITV